MSVRLYELCKAYSTQQAPDPTKTPDVAGWRAPDQPTVVACCMPQQFRSWDLENLVHGMETIIAPLLQSISNATGGGYRTYRLRSIEGTTVALPFNVKRIICAGGIGEINDITALRNAANALVGGTYGNLTTQQGGDEILPTSGDAYFQGNITYKGTFILYG